MTDSATLDARPHVAPLPVLDGAMTYPVNDLYATLQGEGCQTGVPMVLLRLHGCPVGCPFCDTKETWTVDPTLRVETFAAAAGANGHYVEATPQQIATEVRKVGGHGIKWVMLTGGEPALHALYPLVAALHEADYKVAIETSGTALGHVTAHCDWVCVSPKMHMPGGRPVLPRALEIADEIKQVVGNEKDIYRLEGLLSTCILKTDVTICLQPMSQSPKATDICMKTCQARGWRLSLQMHKYIDVR